MFKLEMLILTMLTGVAIAVYPFQGHLTLSTALSECMRAVSWCGNSFLVFSPGTDAAAQAAAAFAACSALYNNRVLSQSGLSSIGNSSYASTLLTHAKQLYSFATNSSITQQTYQTAVPSVGDAYASSGFEDEIAIAELFLSLADNSTDFYKGASQTYQKNGLDDHLSNDAVFNWDEKAPGVAILGAQIAKAYPSLASGVDVEWKDDAEDYLDRIVNQKGRSWVTSGMFTYS